MKQIFVSHTKKDTEICDLFDRAVARVEIKAFRSELENIDRPPWRTIKEAVNNSNALFFLVGKELIKNQDSKSEDWKYTQNWIAYEIGLACQKNIDVWALCDNVQLNFPMPYINNYLDINLRNQPGLDFVKFILEVYKDGGSFAYPYSYPNSPAAFRCAQCGMFFNVHNTIGRGDPIRCPQCLEDLIVFREEEATFRTKKTERIWHWHDTCSQWPSNDFHEKKVKGNPIDGDLCPECTKIDRH